VDKGWLEVLLLDAAGAEDAAAEEAAALGAVIAVGAECSAASSDRTCVTRVAAMYRLPLCSIPKWGVLAVPPAALPNPDDADPALDAAALDAGALVTAPAALGAELDDEAPPREMA
jgi:hypothetical protein